MKLNNANSKLNNIRENISEKLSIPDEVMLNIPLITIVGRSKITVENFKSIVEYSVNIIRINTHCGIFKIEGSNLHIKELTKTILLIKGTFVKFEFIL